VGPDSIVLQAGSNYKDKYVATPLNVSKDGHSVHAALFIKNPSEEDEKFEYFLEVSTEIGSARCRSYN